MSFFKRFKKCLVNLLPYGIVYKRKRKKKLELAKIKAEEKARRKEELARAKAEAKAKAKEEAARRKAEQARLKAEQKIAERMASIHNAPPKKSWEKYYSAYHMNEKIEDNWVLYESSGGIGMTCNPYAIFKAFMKRDDFKDYYHVWVLIDSKEKERLSKKYAEYDNVRFILNKSRAYAYYLTKAKYLINNTSFPAVFSKRNEQVFVDTWHSTTVKYLGYDVKGGNFLNKNMIRNLLMADYIISPNSFMTKIFNESFFLKNIYTGKYFEEGFPRNDAFFNTTKEETVAYLKELGIEINPDKKILLYAPTWTGNKVSNPVIDMSKYTDFFAYINEKFSDEYQVLIKPHQVVYKQLSKAEKATGLYIPFNVDTNELLSIVDVLVTDYSSIYFDYLPTKKPIIFYVPDYKEYENMRGIYFTLDELPGPYSFNLEGVASFIENIDEVKTKYAKVMEETAAWACRYDDGRVAERLLNVIIDNDLNHNLVPAKKEDKKTILFYPGGLHMNGVTSAFKSLLAKIDYEKYDVSVFALSPKDEVTESNIDSLPKEIRTFVRVGSSVYSSKQHVDYMNLLSNGFSSSRADSKNDYMCKREYMRCFGTAKFDYIIDFSGYGIYFPSMIIKGAPDSKLFIWQHNDLKSDLENDEKMRLNKNATTLEGLKSLYPYCTKIVSASQAIAGLNKKNLSNEKTAEKFTFCNNIIDEQRIETAIKTTEFCEFGGKTMIKIDDEKSESGVCKTVLVPKLKEKDSVVFATVGRCMPEKNHRNLISAINMLRNEGVNAKLYIIGDGHLRPELEQAIEGLGLTDDIAITGFVSNPFAVLRESDCFVFPSNYEAQGLAVLEARMINMPIIVNNYPAVNSVLIDDKQYILDDPSPESILKGLKAYINGEIPTDYVFDLKKYNEEAYSQFENLLN